MEQSSDLQDVNKQQRRLTEAPAKLLLDFFWFQWRIVALPWHALLLGLTCCTGLMVSFLTAVGAPPVSFKDKLKVGSGQGDEISSKQLTVASSARGCSRNLDSLQLKETQKIIEHLHQREDGFRQKLKVSCCANSGWSSMSEYCCGVKRLFYKQFA